MCKSQAEGGQRCAGHAKERMDKLIAEGQASLDRHSRGEITTEEAKAHHEKVRDAMVDYTSTLEGAASFRADLVENEAYAAATGDPDAIGANEDARRIIDDGAVRAQVNREVENAYRATQGKPPLTTPVPQTFAQEAEAQAVEARAAAEKAAKEADPFGLRVEQAVRGVDAMGDADATAAILADASVKQADLEAKGVPEEAQEALRLHGEYLTAMNNLQTVAAAMARGEADEDDLMDAQEEVAEALVNYASTNQGAADMYATLHALNPASPDYEVQLESTLSIIDEGAYRAQTRRAAENVSRAARGLAPLTTPVPQTIAQLEAKGRAMSTTELETARTRMEAAGSRLAGRFDEITQELSAEQAKADDPFGLRAEAAANRT